MTKLVISVLIAIAIMMFLHAGVQAGSHIAVTLHQIAMMGR